jgi:pyridoxal-phosphate dependent enzyme
MASETRPVFQIWPELESAVGFLALGDFPTPVELLDRIVTIRGAISGDVYVKRDDLSSSVYGGNKVRTLEPLLGHARRQGHSLVIATGAYGSNHAVATALHARRVGFRTGVALFPQPCSETAMANLRVSVTQADEVTDLLHWSALPFAIWQRRFAGKRHPPGPFVMPPGGAIPRGCLGFVSAGLELAMQVEQGVMPVPDEVVIALGSTCSTAGLLVGLRLAARLGLGWGARPGATQGRGGAPPLLVAVRVTPWPLTSAFRITHLASRVSRWLHALTGKAEFDVSRAELAQGLCVDGSELGAGYGLPTPAGLRAIEQLAPFSAALDTTYSAKSAAALLARCRRGGGVRLFWSTKSGAPLPDVAPRALEAAPARMSRWLARGSTGRAG